VKQRERGLMPIVQREKKVEKIAEVISDGKTAKGFTDKFGGGPTLYFYRKLLHARHHARDVMDFVNDRRNLELCYCVLGLWGMNTRGARLKEFDNFCDAVERARSCLIETESVEKRRIH